MIFDKGAKAIQWSKGSLQQMVLEQLNIHMQKNESKHIPHSLLKH